MEENFTKEFIRDIAILDKLKKEEEQNFKKILAAVRRRRSVRVFWRACSACAAVALLVLAFDFVFVSTFESMSDSKAKEKTFIEYATVETPLLITENGHKVDLNSNHSYTLEYPAKPADKVAAKAGYGHAVEMQTKGQPSSKIHTVSRNTVIIPNGYTYDIKFDDGTLAHINSGSYIEYPKSFSNKDERVVKLEGEGYFKVSKSDKPFIVKTCGVEVKVYGTEFNINTNKENRVEVLLVSGSVGVKCNNDANEILLEPKQMLVYNSEEDRMHTLTVDAEDYLGWMKGDFTCNNSSLFDLLDEICAFYGIQIATDDKLSDKMVTISLSRKLGFRQIMEIMEPAFGLDFKQNDKMNFTCTESPY